MRAGENLLCSAVQHTILEGSSSTQSRAAGNVASLLLIGLKGGIRDRPDFHFAREAVDLTLHYASYQEQHVWNEHQTCTVSGKEAEILMDVKFFGGETGIVELTNPGLEAVFQLKSGWVIRQLIGLRITLSLRVDGQGYEIIQSESKFEAE